MPGLDEYRNLFDSTHDDPNDDPDYVPVFLAGAEDDFEVQGVDLNSDSIEDGGKRVISVRERFERAFDVHAKPKANDLS